MDLSISSSSLFGFVFLRARVEWIFFLECQDLREGLRSASKSHFGDGGGGGAVEEHGRCCRELHRSEVQRLTSHLRG
jgi:hypothetical protein